MSKRVTVARAMVSIGVGLVLGLLLAGPADAAVPNTRFSPSQPAETKNDNRNIYILGQDGAIWYTSVDPGGEQGNVTTGNSANPFDSPRAGEAGCPSACTGFVGATKLARACADTGDTCVGIWVRLPGLGTFIDAPMVTKDDFICKNSHNIIAPGFDGSLWMTLFDAKQKGTMTTMDTGCPLGNPFRTAGEDENSGAATSGTGFVNQFRMNRACEDSSDTCTGIWMKW